MIVGEEGVHIAIAVEIGKLDIVAVVAAIHILGGGGESAGTVVQPHLVILVVIGFEGIEIAVAVDIGQVDTPAVWS